MKKLLVTLSFLISVLLFLQSVLAEDVNLGTYDVVKSNATMISPPPQTTQTQSTPSPRTLIRSALPPDPNKRVADSYIVQNVGADYFNNHFVFSYVDKRDFASYVNYNFTYGNYSTNMFVTVSSDGSVISDISHVIAQPQIISFDDNAANLKADQLALQTPRTTSLVYSDQVKSLAWSVEWNHIPTYEEKSNQTISGYIFKADNGDILRTLQFKFEPVENESNPSVPSTNVLIVFLIATLLIFLSVFYKRRRLK